jgi:hypothetical protein
MGLSLSSAAPTTVTMGSRGDYWDLCCMGQNLTQEIKLMHRSPGYARRGTDEVQPGSSHASGRSDIYTLLPLPAQTAVIKIG